MYFHRKGFTLMEIMVVLVLIGTIVGIASISASTYLKASRDSNRITSIRQISEALLGYYTTYGIYPTHDAGCVPFAALIPGFASTIPKSPSGPTYDEGCGPNGNFAYAAMDQSFTLLATMERPLSGNYSGTIAGLTGVLTQEALARVLTTSAAGTGKYYVAYQAGYNAIAPTTGSDGGGGNTAGNGEGPIPSVVNGICSPSIIGECTAGDSLTPPLLNAATCGETATWSCIGRAGGATASCSKPITCITITFDANEGTGSETRTKGSGIEIGTLPVATRDNYIFMGWYTTLTGGTLINQHTIAHSNTTYYARWRAPCLRDGFVYPACTAIGQEYMASSIYPGCSSNDKIICTCIERAQVWSLCNVGSTNAGTGIVSYGNFFQWGRNVAFPNPENFTGVAGPLSATGADATEDFIGVAGLPFGQGDWLSVRDDNRWGGSGVSNTGIFHSIPPDQQLLMRGPCAPGYHVPTRQEWCDVIDSILGGPYPGVPGSQCWYNSQWPQFSGSKVPSVLMLPPAGEIYSQGWPISHREGLGKYWISNINKDFAFGIYADQIYFDGPRLIYPTSMPRANLASVRCIKNEGP